MACKETPMTRILKEPFIHFLLIGALVFAVNAVGKNTGDNVNRDCAPKVEPEIVLTPDIIDSLESTEGPSTLEEKKAAWVRDEVLFREGIARKLDADDATLKSRVIEKMRLIAMEQASMAPIPEKEITAFYKKNIDSFSWPGRVSIAQLYFSTKKRGDVAKSDCEAAFKRVLEEPDTTPEALAAIADKQHGLRTYMAKLGEEKLTNLFGKSNAGRILSVESPGWIAPVQGTTGWHLIRVTEVISAGTSPLNAVRSRIEKVLENERNKKAVEAFAEAAKKKYRIVTPGTITQ